MAACLKRLNFSLQRNRKSIGETRHPQRDQQFRHLSAIKASFEDRGQPVISVDSKKRELVGLFLNPGQTWCWMGREVLTHDFRSQSFGVALPYQPVAKVCDFLRAIMTCLSLPLSMNLLREMRSWR